MKRGTNEVECAWTKTEAAWEWTSEAVRNEKGKEMEKRMVAGRNEQRRVYVEWKMAEN